MVVWRFGCPYSPFKDQPLIFRRVEPSRDYSGPIVVDRRNTVPTTISLSALVDDFSYSTLAPSLQSRQGSISPSGDS